jgi:hypothetical protein
VPRVFKVAFNTSVFGNWYLNKDLPVMEIVHLGSEQFARLDGPLNFLEAIRNFL